jgi:hypothetical protein
MLISCVHNDNAPDHPSRPQISNTVKTLRAYLHSDAQRQFIRHNAFTSFTSPNIPLPPTIQKVIADDDMDKYRRLIKKQKLSDLDGLHMSAQHFIMVKNDQVVAGVSILCAVNKIPGVMAISIERLVSVQKGAATLLIRMLHKFLMKRAVSCTRPCYLVTQSCLTRTSRAFWSKTLVFNKRALILNFMFFMLDNRFRIYQDVECMYREY